MLECSARKVVIIVGGMVGAGKSTLVNKLRDVFLNERVCTLNMTAYPNVSYFFFTLLAAFFYGRKTVKFYEERGVHPSTLVIKRLQRTGLLFSLITTLIEIVSVHLWIIYMHIRCWQMRVVIVDEGFINAVANYVEVLGKESNILIHYILSMLNSWRRKHKLVLVFLSANLNALRERWFKRERPVLTRFIGLDHHFRYLGLMKFSVRLFIRSGFNVLVVDTSYKRPDEVAEEVIKTLYTNLY